MLTSLSHRYQESRHAHRGILDVEQFSRVVSLHCYKPSADLDDLVEHCFVARWQVPKGQLFTATDVLTGPVVNMFFTSEGAYLNGVVSGKRVFRLQGTGVYAGVKFRAGGFYAFFRRPVAGLAELTLPAMDVFAGATHPFSQKLLALSDDQDVVAQIETLLRRQKPEPSIHMATINHVMKVMAKEDYNVAVSVLAGRVGLSERSLQRLYWRHVGVGIKWQLQRARFLEAAAEAYKPGRINWTMVALELGYSTPSHFTNEFKRLVGMSPSQYRKLIHQPVQLADL